MSIRQNLCALFVLSGIFATGLGYAAGPTPEQVQAHFRQTEILYRLDGILKVFNPVFANTSADYYSDVDDWTDGQKLRAFDYQDYAKRFGLALETHVLPLVKDPAPRTLLLRIINDLKSAIAATESKFGSVDADEISDVDELLDKSQGKVVKIFERLQSWVDMQFSATQIPTFEDRAADASPWRELEGKSRDAISNYTALASVQLLLSTIGESEGHEHNDSAYEAAAELDTVGILLKKIAENIKAIKSQNRDAAMLISDTAERIEAAVVDANEAVENLDVDSDGASNWSDATDSLKSKMNDYANELEPVLLILEQEATSGAVSLEQSLAAIRNNPAALDAQLRAAILHLIQERAEVMGEIQQARAALIHQQGEREQAAATARQQLAAELEQMRAGEAPLVARVRTLTEQATAAEGTIAARTAEVEALEARATSAQTTFSQLASLGNEFAAIRRDVLGDNTTGQVLAEVIVDARNLATLQVDGFNNLEMLLTDKLQVRMSALKNANPQWRELAGGDDYNFTVQAEFTNVRRVLTSRFNWLRFHSRHVKAFSGDLTVQVQVSKGNRDHELSRKTSAAVVIKKLHVTWDPGSQQIILPHVVEKTFNQEVATAVTAAMKEINPKVNGVDFVRGFEGICQHLLKLAPFSVADGKPL